MKHYLTIILLLFAGYSQATNIPVTSTADSGPGTLREAVTNASDGDSISFDAAINGTPIVLSSEIPVNNSIYFLGNDTTNTIISGGDVTRIFIVDDTVHFSGIRFQNGSYPSVNSVTGGAIGVNQTGVIYVNGCDFSNNSACFGGAIQVYLGADAYIEKSSFYRNTGLGTSNQGGAAICVSYGNGSVLSVTNTSFEENECLQGGGRAGTIYGFGGEYIINNCEFLNNTVESTASSYNAQGGAIHCRGFGTYAYSLSIEDSYFDGNTAIAGNSGARGGAICVEGPGNVSMLRSTIINSIASSGDGVASGGGFYFDSDTLVLADCYFESNAVLATQGTFSARGGGLYMQNARPYIERCTFSNNGAISADQYSSGGALLGTSGIDTMRISNSTFYGNVSNGGTGSYGGAIYDQAITSYYTNNTIVSNSCSGGTQSSGGGLGLYRAYGYRELRNNIISDNTTTNNFADVYWETTTTYVIDQNLIRDMAPVSLPIAYTTDPGLDPAGPQMNGGLMPTIAVVNPLSEVIDNASAFAPTFDQRGAIRNGNPDLGAYEFNGCVETSSSITESVCVSYTSPSGGEVYTSSGIYMDTIANTLGCDSVLTIDLTILTPTAASIQVNACETYTVPSGNQTYVTSGIYMDTISNQAGCDSVLTIDLTVNFPTTGTDVITECDSYTWIDGNTYTTSNNTATHTISGGAANGCDSVVTLDLTINYYTTGTDVITACDSYQWIDGNTYTASNNTATHTISGGSANGCDSVVTLDLTINYSTTGTDVITACDSYQWIDGNTYTSSNNTATHTISGGAANGCDSVVTLDLTINYSTTGTDVITACESYQWIDGTTYTASNNTATHTISGGAANGCDSIVTLDLTINYSTTGTDAITACNSYTWIDGTTYTASNNTATHTISGGAANGCDSVVTLDLTINFPTTGTDAITACNSYTWIDGTTYTASNNTATHTISGGAANGCDSVVTLDLTINFPTTGTDVITECDSYTWIDGTTYTTSNNTATHTISGGSTNGCDSLVTLDLTINYSTTGTDVITACDSYTWMDGNTYTSSNNTATWTVTNSMGCDSLVTLDLTIVTTTAGIAQVNDITLEATNTGASYVWIDCSTGMPVPGETAQSFEASANGEYAVVVTENNCSDTSDCMVIDQVRLEENSIQLMRVYPNPNNGEFTVTLNELTNGKLVLYTADGRVVYSQAIHQESEELISVPTLTNGIYFLELRTEKGNYSKRITIKN